MEARWPVPLGPIHGQAMDEKREIMIIAGEASGDIHGAHLVKAMRASNRDLAFFGIGGNALRQAGVRVFIDNAEIAVVGISEAFSKAGILLSALRTVKEELKRVRPDLVIVIDFPDFNLQVAKAATRLGIPVMYYISPQIWAWRRGRVKKIKKVVDHMVVIFPFEVTFYEKWDVPVTFVGHPLLDNVNSGTSGEPKEDLAGKGPLIGLLPGSRNGEVRHLFPTMVQAADMLSEKVPDIRFAVPVASSVDRALVESMARQGASNFLLLSDRLQDILDKSTLVVTASGTVTLEAAIAGTPMIIVYKLSGFSYWFGKRFIQVKHIGLVNLVAGRRVVPELIQDEASAENISRQVLQMLADKDALVGMRRQLRDVVRRLGDPGASERAAAVAMGLLSGN
ncbi:MAG: lipid-A-disaccharide synthase [Thermodesulfobacteriota bacterium]|nr:lipid-A-disaccharide synthase [Thermodesulfobacteriota bacterium]